MKLLNHESETTTMHVLKFQLDDGSVVYYKEWTNSSGQVVDSQIISKHGFPLDHEVEGELIERIQEEADRILN